MPRNTKHENIFKESLKGQNAQTSWRTPEQETLFCLGHLQNMHVPCRTPPSHCRTRPAITAEHGPSLENTELHCRTRSSTEEHVRPAARRPCLPVCARKSWFHISGSKSYFAILVGSSPGQSGNNYGGYSTMLGSFCDPESKRNARCWYVGLGSTFNIRVEGTAL